MPGWVRYNEKSKFQERSSDGGATFVVAPLTNPIFRTLADGDTLLVSDGCSLSIIDYYAALGAGVIAVSGDGILEIRN